MKTNNYVISSVTTDLTRKIRMATADHSFGHVCHRVNHTKGLCDRISRSQCKDGLCCSVTEKVGVCLTLKFLHRECCNPIGVVSECCVTKVCTDHCLYEANT
ncbi:hypothetical protein CHUAL_011352 [Chamberlinius hualienensis]